MAFVSWRRHGLELPKSVAGPHLIAHDGTARRSIEGVTQSLNQRLRVRFDQRTGSIQAPDAF
jgi:hypothetical protein